ncbi:MAG: response regulator [candidate division Zixibacteria bacterium]|nr:response regulator [candidate division Zixibacteria bacterium]
MILGLERMTVLESTKAKKPATILIVDDEENSFDVRKRVLESNGYRVLTAKNGLEALTHVEQKSPDIILLDIMMPYMNGFEVCERIKSSPKWRDIPIIVITVLNDTQTYIRAIDLGADDFLTRPIEPSALLARVRGYLRSRELSREVERVSRLKQDLTDMIIHDLRGPLSSVIGNIDLLSMTANLDSEAKDIAEHALNSALQIKKMLQDMLEVEKMESGSFAANMEITDISDLIKKVLEYRISASELDKVKVNLHGPDSLKQSCDPELLSRVVQNLVTNAIKFSAAGSEINIRWHSENESFFMGVENHGAVIEKKQQERIFDKYFQASKESRTGQKGIGLGLTFCKMAMEAQGGNIQVSSPVPGWDDGIRFEVQLPCPSN